MQENHDCKLYLIFLGSPFTNLLEIYKPACLKNIRDTFNKHFVTLFSTFPVINTNASFTSFWID